MRNAEIRQAIYKEISGTNLSQRKKIPIIQIIDINTLSPLVVFIGKNPFRANPGEYTSQIASPNIKVPNAPNPIALGRVQCIQENIFTSSPLKTL